MKLKKNDLISLRKAGVKAIEKKLSELKAEFLTASINGKSSQKLTRRSLSQLLTIRKEIQ